MHLNLQKLKYQNVEGISTVPTGQTFWIFMLDENRFFEWRYYANRDIKTVSIWNYFQQEVIECNISNDLYHFYCEGWRIIRLCSSSLKVLRLKLILLWSKSNEYSTSLRSKHGAFEWSTSFSLMNTVLKVCLVALEGKYLFEIQEFVLCRH